jgi:hypothetical protein
MSGCCDMPRYCVLHYQHLREVQVSCYHCDKKSLFAPYGDEPVFEYFINHNEERSYPANAAAMEAFVKKTERIDYDTVVHAIDTPEMQAYIEALNRENDDGG